MSSRLRQREEIGANKSDSEDDDYEDRPRHVKRQKLSSTKHKKRKGPSRKKRRHNSDDDDDDDDDDIIDESSLEASSDSDEVPVEYNETGRPVRRTTKKPTKYAESSEDDLAPLGEDIEEDEEDEDVRRARPIKSTRSKQLKRTRSQIETEEEEEEEEEEEGEEEVEERAEQEDEPLRSLVVKLKMPPNWSPGNQRRTSRRQSAAKTINSPTQTQFPGQRRSRRISHDETDPLVALTTSGRHVVTTRAGSNEPEATVTRATQGGKRPPTTSAIIEASQEDSGRSKMEDDTAMVEEDVQEQNETHSQVGDEADDGDVVHESVHGNDNNDEDDEDPVAAPQTRRSTRNSGSQHTRGGGSQRRKTLEESSDFDPGAAEDMEADDDDVSSDEGKPLRKRGQRSEDSSSGRRSERIAKRRKQSSDEDAIDEDELAMEAAELDAAGRRKRRRHGDIIFDAPPRLRNRREKVDYRIFRPELAQQVSDDDQPGPETSMVRGRKTQPLHRTLFSTLGPFGGAGGPPPIFAGPEGQGAVGGADSDSSDDEVTRKAPRGFGGTVGMTPTAGIPQPFQLPAPLNSDPTQQGATAGLSNFGKVKDRKTLADSDPLGVDTSVNFEGVGGLDNHINQLKEMVALPLLYPEVFQQFHVTPPRGVLFHGPPGTGKTLLARALASSVSAQGKKVTFYMRKGADALSKWVGEAERQLRLLFEEARKNQPSIIFFDEIDGLAPVRSSKQEQIHASIVATLLALMDGMDGRGQVIVIGATNRPDSVDPALRRPGRFDREFYFPLPDQNARSSIIDIHTKGWDPPLKPEFKKELAKLTKGYGGADLRALCTEAALNAVQGTYPQIYKSDQKLLIDPAKIKVLAKDFMISVNKIIPSGERAASSGAAPLDSTVEPLLRENFQKISVLLDEVLPQKKRVTALEEAEYDDRDDEQGFQRELMQQDFERSRVFRPRLLIYGQQGMGQGYIGSALLHKFERVHVQSFDLSVLYGDATRSPENTVVQLFTEVRRHKPSVIYIPNVNIWYEQVGRSVVKLFAGLLRSLPPNDPIMLLGIMEAEKDENLDEGMLRDLFGFTNKSHYQLDRPRSAQRFEFFQKIVDTISTPPSSLPDGLVRQKRNLPVLEVAPSNESTSKGPTKEELKALKKQDRHALNLLKIAIQQVMDHIKNKYKKFRHPPIDESLILYLFEEQTPGMITTDVPEEQDVRLRPFEIRHDDKGVKGLLEVATGKFYYNLEIVTIEKRLSNGYYKRPRDFLADIKRLAKDAKNTGDEDRILKANELVSNVEVDMQVIEESNPPLVAMCEQVYQREQERARQLKDQLREQGRVTANTTVPINVSNSTVPSTGPITLGEPIPGKPPFNTPARLPLDTSTSNSQLTNGDFAAYSQAHYQHQQQQQQVMSNGSPTSHSHSLSQHPSNEHAEADDEDIEMANSQDPSSPVYNASPTRPFQQKSDSAPVSQSQSQFQRSQRSAITPLAHNSQPADYHNSASTTTSGNKTGSNEDKSHSRNSHASSNGVAKDDNNTDHPDFSAAHPMSGGSQLPDTQEGSGPGANSSSNGSSQAAAGNQQGQPNTQVSSSQPMGPPRAPPFPTGSTDSPSLFNYPVTHTHTTTSPVPLKPPHDPAKSSPAPQPTPSLLLDKQTLSAFHAELVKRTSGCSVEQLEQLHAALMGAVWRTRGSWNRNSVVLQAQKAFNECVNEIEEAQGFGAESGRTGEDEEGVEGSASSPV